MNCDEPEPPDANWSAIPVRDVVEQHGALQGGVLVTVVLRFSNRPDGYEVFEKKGATGMSTGTIKKLVQDRGFGFIAADDGKEYFFHRSGLDSLVDFDSLTGGEAVTFDVERSDKGPRAGNVRLSN